LYQRSPAEVKSFRLHHLGASVRDSGQVHPTSASEEKVERELDPDPEGIGERRPATPTTSAFAPRWWRRRESNPRPKTSLRETLQV